MQRRRAAAEAAAKEAQRVPRPSAEEVRARFAQAATGEEAAETPDQEQAREAREQQAEDDENEELFAEYEPLHYCYGQPHPTPSSRPRRFLSPICHQSPTTFRSRRRS